MATFLVPPHGVYIFSLFGLQTSSLLAGFNVPNTTLTSKLLQEEYRYHKLRNAFSKFYRRHYELVSKHESVLKTCLLPGLSEP